MSSSVAAAAVVSVLLVSLAAGQSPGGGGGGGSEETRCGPCEPSSCPLTPDQCEAGMVKDRCDCCLVCGQREGQLCDLPGDSSHQQPGRYGKCGDDLECRPRPDAAHTGHTGHTASTSEALCYCRYTETICGTDGHTYRSLCKLMESAYRMKANDSDGNTLKVDHKGPCRSAPWIETAPESVDSEVGDDIVLTCEVMGYPIPAVEWTVTGYDGNNIRLPSDMDHIAVQARGGPEQYEVTSWLQIQGVTPTDEGEYVCTGDNSLGNVRAAVRVNVLDKDKYLNNKEFLGGTDHGYNKI